MAATYKWIVLERNNWSSGTGDQDYRVAFYADIPAGTANADGVLRKDFYANALFTSAYNGLPPADLAEIQAGTIREVVRSISYSSALTNTQILADLDARATVIQADVVAESAAKGDRYGTARRANGTLRSTSVT